MTVSEKNIESLELVAKKLGDLVQQIVFVGGATLGLYLDDETHEVDAIRPTEDVDCVVEVANRVKFAELEKKLRTLGFRNSMEPGATICRWTCDGVVVGHNANGWRHIRIH